MGVTPRDGKDRTLEPKRTESNITILAYLPEWSAMSPQVNPLHPSAETAALLQELPPPTSRALNQVGSLWPLNPLHASGATACRVAADHH